MSNLILWFDTDTPLPLSKTITEVENQLKLKPRHLLVCAHCQHAITSEIEKILIRDSMHHRCTNPFGLSFNLTCYKEAFGCTIDGQPVAADSWFPGYFWRYALCENCHIHLGWYYLSAASETNYFYGLIDERLLRVNAQ